MLVECVAQLDATALSVLQPFAQDKGITSDVKPVVYPVKAGHERCGGNMAGRRLGVEWLDREDWAVDHGEKLCPVPRWTLANCV